MNQKPEYFTLNLWRALHAQPCHTKTLVSLTYHVVCPNVHLRAYYYIIVYAYQTSNIFLQKNPLNLYFNTRNHFRDEITRLVINTRLITTLKNVDMFKIIEFYWFMHSTFCSWQCFEFLLCILWKMVLFVCNFQTWQRVQTIAKCKYFLLFYHNNIMLKIDIMLGYW